MTQFEFDRAQTVVIGGGVIGASVAYHLVENGAKDVLLLDRHEVGEGTSWHSPGLVGLVRVSSVGARVARAARGFYQDLHDIYGDDSGWHADGGLRLAKTLRRAAELKTMAMMAEAAGTESEVGGPEVAEAAFPALDTKDLQLAVACPEEGWAEAFPLTRSIVAEGRKRGLRVLEGTNVTGFDLDGAAVSAIYTWRGRIACERVVIAGGCASGVIGAMAGVTLPMHTVLARFAIVEPKSPIEGGFPVVRDSDSESYFRRDPKGVMAGGDLYEPELYDVEDPMPVPRMLWSTTPAECKQQIAAVEQQLSALRGGQLVSIVRGPEAFTPDGEMLVGQTPVPGLWVAAPGSGHGVAFGGGVGKCVAELMLAGESEIDVSELDVNRYLGDAALDPEQVRRLSIDAYRNSLEVRPELAVDAS